MIEEGMIEKMGGRMIREKKDGEMVMDEMVEDMEE